MADLITTNILSFIYGVLFAVIVCMWLHNRAERRHYAELQTLKGTHDAERNASQGTPYILPALPAGPYLNAFNEVSTRETLKLLMQEQGRLAKRFEQLEGKLTSVVA